MKGNNQNNYDRRPKRRKDKLNPYTLYSIGKDTDDPHFFVSFNDVNNNQIEIEVDKEVFDAFERFELEDLSYSNEVTNHYEHSDLLESTLIRRSNENNESLEDTVIERMRIDNIHSALSSLTPKQRRRVFMYYFEGMNYQEIAQREGCKHQSVCDSIAQSIKRIKKELSDT